MADFGGRYKLVKALGEGAMGMVWLALDEELQGRRVAIKVMKSHLVQNPEGVARFQQELGLAARMQHPNIVTVFTSGVENGTPFMVMEYLQGHDLTRVPDGWGATEIARAGRETCAALAYAHGRNVVHRDIKPSNLFVCGTGLVKVTDFGVGKALTESNADMPGTFAGTPLYMAPEQWLGKPATFAIDIWATGCTLYALLSGKLPREYSLPVEYIEAAKRRERVRHLKDVAGQVPSWLAEAVMAMLEPDPAARPTAAGCQTLLSGPSARPRPAPELQARPIPEPASQPERPGPQRPSQGHAAEPKPSMGQGQPPYSTVSIRRDHAPQRPERTFPSPTARSQAPWPEELATPVRRTRHQPYRWPVVLAAVITAAASLGVLCVFLLDRHAGTSWSATASLAATFDPAGGGNAALAPDADILAVGTTEDNASNNLPAGGITYLWNTKTRKVIAALADPRSSGVQSVAFGPGGTTLAAGDWNGTIYLWNIKTGKITAALADPGSSGVQSVAFGPGGTTLAAVDHNGTAYLWDIKTRKVAAALADPGGGVVQSVAFAPGGTTLATGDQNGTTYLRNIKTGKITAALADPGSSGVQSVAFGPGGTTLAAGDHNYSTYVWNTTTGKIITTLTVRSYSTNVESVAFDAVGGHSTILATMDLYGVHLWNITTGQIIANLTDPESGGLSSLSVGPGGATLAIGSGGGVYLWNITIRKS
jgi:serine/threonine protein kinase/WD40 repeat protein